EYLRLGQPLSSLSGGEAQRLKLIRHLSCNGTSGSQRTTRKLFLLDEPTTGLHPHDIEKLVRVLDLLVKEGNTVVVVEHNLDLLDACDWIIELGPEGGEDGGRIVAVGPPEVIAENTSSPTGRFLNRRRCGETPSPFLKDAAINPGPSIEQELKAGSSNGNSIVVRGAREHNLKLSSIRVPRERMTVLTGLSGSGKSTLAFDVLFAEGQRRYLECLSTYVRQYFKILEKPDVDQILGLPPTVAIEQRTSRLNRRSTVATITEVYHFLRLLYSKLGRQRCPECGRGLAALSHDAILSLVEREMAKEDAKILAPLVRGRKGIYRDLFLRLRKMGFHTVRVDGQWMDLALVPALERHREHDIEVLIPHGAAASTETTDLSQAVRKALGLGGGTLHLAGEETRVLSDRLYCPDCNRGLAPLDPRLFSFNSKLGACTTCTGLGTVQKINEDRLLGPPHLSLREALWEFLDTSIFRGRFRSWGARLHEYWTHDLRLDLERPVGELGPVTKQAMLHGRENGFPGLLPILEKCSTDEKIQRALSPYYEDVTCPDCAGTRLNRQARSVDFKGRTITQMVDLSIRDFQELWKSVEFTEAERPVGLPILREIQGRVAFLREVGLDYLTLSRSGDTLSGGEAQRIRLAAQLGSNLLGVCYILDEPTIGLHPVDNERLLDGLLALKRKGNTIVVVEHDAETMRRADLLIELGPAAGKDGGRMTAQGDFQSLCRDDRTLTGQWFGTPVGELYRLIQRRPFSPSGWIEVSGAAERNLKGIDVKVPLGTLTCVTGVSGAGKSTLVHEVIYRGLSQLIGKGNGRAVHPRAEIKGADRVYRVVEVDHNPIGRTSRSIPATYVGIWDEIRRLYSMLPESRVRGFKPGHFSFNVKGGRCENCKGQGLFRVEMHFLPDVFVPCESCSGKRFNEDTLAVRLKGKSIADVLAMTLEEASRFFSAFPRIARSLRALNELGLGYLTLGQPSPTLSGGEAQRIKLAGELGNHRNPTLYLLDEPTTGLHRADVKKLLDVMHALTDHGHTVLVIEHNLDFVWASDYVIDLGPGSGDLGGQLVAEGTPEQILHRTTASPTAGALARYLEADSKTCL
ncbi:MAG: excinuclease ABC subunit UvrA, partial [Syntrophobacteraceae bacterium]|nr:excinuclease ABC subunit UvrA [Syntrophobacteraceae bacterium]